MQNNDKEQKTSATDGVQAYLESLHKTGAELFVDGESVLPYEAVRRTVREEFSYMADYVLGESGKIEQIRFDKVEV